MNKTDDALPTIAARRGFLHTTGTVGLLGAALSLLSRAVPASAVVPLASADDDTAKPSGYHESEHIRKYYAKLRQL